MSTSLIDTGALDSDYISSRLAGIITKLDYSIDDTVADNVRTPFTNMPHITCLGL